ncbi:MAG: hypothetical protein JXO22_16310, partial [Phycisphaerae bacterium]|nr:hypothetical protein [Phycisphaerae bacterium]
GQIALKTGDMEVAVKNFQEAVTIREGLVAQDPSNLQNTEYVAHAHDWLGRAYSQDGQLDSAVAHYERACYAYSELANRQPDVADRVYDATRCQSNLAAAHMKFHTQDHDACARVLLEEAYQALASLRADGHLAYRQKRFDALADGIQTNLRLLEKPPEQR